ncbi:e329b030-9501-407b-bac1-7673d2003618 [Thermothielavioides terrestris]|uniref:Conserved oligomeric Golgi complex subunit 5 n=1 Tax=Thermothielavioides terrestris TaxID=2587410 RepID=A0A446BT13_9PEZI|nr:e329b030-9501-407b-bac1-7673d2003618 [Thermothielavioides terrestris]
MSAAPPAPPDFPVAAGADEPSYIDYEAFLSPTFHAPTFANTLVLATNNPSDSPLDLSTPLARVLFDVQEVSAHIDRLTARAAEPLLARTAARDAAAARLLAALEPQLRALNESHAQLARAVAPRYAEAVEVRRVAENAWRAQRLARAVARLLGLARQLEAQFAELVGPGAGSGGAVSGGGGSGRGGGGGGGDVRGALVRCAGTLLAVREMFSAEAAGTTTATGQPTQAGTEGIAGQLERVAVVRSVRDGVVAPVEKAVRETAERVVREFSLGSATGSGVTFAQGEEVRGRTVAALTTLWLLTPVPSSSGKAAEKWAPTLMLQALEAYLRSALQSSIAGLSRALSTLPSLERTLAEVSARCQNIVALEAVLEGSKAPQHPLLPQGKQAQAGGNMLQPLLSYLETGSLASYFWRTMAGSMAPRVQEIMAKGGVPARTLRTNRQSVSEAIRECVIRGSQLPGPMAAAARGKPKATERDTGAKQWEREVAVMVGSIVNSIGR